MDRLRQRSGCGKDISAADRCRAGPFLGEQGRQNLDFLQHPPDIRRVLKKVKVLPPLFTEEGTGTATIRCADVFTAAASLSEPVHYVIGNPPWSSAKSQTATALAW